MSHFVPSNEQRSVIEYSLEPLRVIAGAGTGKTTTVAHRIAHLVTTHGIDPEQILGITFTNKAADELTIRIREVLGDRYPPDRQVEVHTYHGFAASILGEFGALVGVDRDAPVVTPTFTRQMLGEILATVRLAPLDQTYAGTVDRVRQLATQMSDHLVEPEDLIRYQDLHDSSGQSDPAVGAERRAILEAVMRYRAEKRRLGVLDYGDLIEAACRAVVDHPWLVERIRERYRSVVLDEYQDTNAAQRILLSTIFGSGFPVTAVGDPDQTIYEWRGASLGNFARFPDHFARVDGSPATSRSLTLNRRSGPNILEAANRITARIDDRPRSALQPVPDADEDAVRAGWFKDAVAEAEWIADDILDQHSAGWQWKDMGILFRKNKDMALVRDALAARDIPVEVANLGGLLSVPEVVEVHAWLRLLADVEDGPAIARILMGSMHRLGLGDLARLDAWTRAVNPDRPRTDVSSGSRRLLLEAIDHLDEIDGLAPSTRDSLERFRHRFGVLIRSAQTASLVELTREILDVIGAWDQIEALSDSSRLSARLNLYRFLDLTERWSPLEGRPSLGSFIEYLSIMDDEPAEELDTARLAGADAVTLLTVHRAKGLEWPIVYIPGTRLHTFPSRVTGSFDNPYTRAESLPYELRADRQDLPDLRQDQSLERQKELLRERHNSQEWRLAYVAVTRGRRQVTVTGAYWYGQPVPNRTSSPPSPLYELISSSPSCQIVSTCDDPGESPETLRSSDPRLQPPDPLFGDQGWQQALHLTMLDPSHPDQLAADMGVADGLADAVDGTQGLLFGLPKTQVNPASSPDESQKYTSVTGLVTYAVCPRRFFWTEVDRLPRRYSAAARRGVDVHRRIELHHRGVMSLDELTPDLYDMVTDETVRPDAAGAGSAFEVFAASRFAATRPHLIETPFELRIRNRSIRGRIDAVYRHIESQPDTPTGWEIVDFKSGRQPDHLAQDPARLVQLQAYAVALHGGALIPDPPEVSTVTFAYLGDGLVEDGTQVDPSWLATASDRLHDIVDGIDAEAFDATPGEGCRRCDFLTFCEPGRRHMQVDTDA